MHTLAHTSHNLGRAVCALDIFSLSRYTLALHIESDRPGIRKINKTTRASLMSSEERKIARTETRRKREQKKWQMHFFFILAQPVRYENNAPPPRAAFQSHTNMCKVAGRVGRRKKFFHARLHQKVSLLSSVLYELRNFVVQTLIISLCSVCKSLSRLVSLLYFARSPAIIMREST